jgi:hypothetical protein
LRFTSKRTSFAVLAILTLAVLPTTTRSEPSAAYRPIQGPKSLKVVSSASGATIVGAFGLFSHSRSVANCDPNLLTYTVVYVGNVKLPALVAPPMCGTPVCPSGSSGIGSCISNTTSMPLGPCNQVCTDWICNEGGNQCCGSCRWSTQPCSGCITTSGCKS